MAGAQCGITNSVEPGQIVLGSPHVPLKEARRIFILWRELPDMVKRIKQLEAKLEKLLPGSSEEGAS
jgi:UDP-3-O-[3-hydroxymyristoyl] glucosamine N-acyltransferase